ncbi:MAG: DJ-1/PfpI family protein [Thermoplasmata archaeon]
MAGGKKILMIVAPKNFRDEEYLHPREVFEKAGHRVTVASTTTDTAYGSISAKIKPDILLKDVKPQEYDAVVFAGGAGCAVYIGDKDATKIAQEAYKGGKLVCAICKAPTILAAAGLLKGRKATVWDSPENREILEKNGAIYTGQPVEQDGKIITGNGPKAAYDFGKKIVENL